MKLRFRPYTLQLKNPFGLAHGSRNTTPVVLVQLEHNGLVGFGEASLPPYLGETQESVSAFLSKLDFSMYSDDDIHNDIKILGAVDRVAPGNNAAKAAVDIALHDLMSKNFKRPLYKVLGLDTPELKPTSFTVAIDELKNLPRTIKEGQNFKILKIKLGTKEDEEIVKVVKNETDKRLYADANQGWSDKTQAHELIHMLHENGFEVVEQPMPVNCADDDMRWLKERSPLPVLADEAVKRLTDLEKAKDLFHGINIKLMKSTGIAEAVKMIYKAREMNLKIMIGCMTETSCAVLAAAHIASLADYVDLDGPFLISNSPFDNPELVDGCIVVPEKPGIGLEF